MICRLCPRECGAQRTEQRGSGFCGMPAGIRVARAALHRWEEPPISGTNGSGAVFFSGCTLRCTEDDLYQICFNLMENAIKYNLPGGKVFVSVCRDGDQVLLEVADTGIGIPEEELPKVFNRFYRVDKDQERIFERFYRTDPARSRDTGGTGLGLSIVRDTVRRHGGWITAQRRQPEGSVFTAGFPCETPEVGGEPL